MSAFLEALTIPTNLPELKPFIPVPKKGKELTSGVVLGSFKYYEQLVQVIHEFRRFGIDILAPQVSTISGRTGDFDLLESDKNLRLGVEKIWGPINDRLFAALTERVFLDIIYKCWICLYS